MGNKQKTKVSKHGKNPTYEESNSTFQFSVRITVIIIANVIIMVIIIIIISKHGKNPKKEEPNSTFQFSVKAQFPKCPIFDPPR